MFRYVGSKPAALAASLALFAGLGFAGRAAAQAPDVEAAVRASRFVFAGTVEKTAASNVDLLPASEATIVVRVDAVIDIPASVSATAGTLVTVELARPGSARAGERAIFFANGRLYSDHLAVRELARRTDDGGYDGLRADVAMVRIKVADEAFSARLAAAPAVVTGRVVDTRPVLAREETGGGEHEAQWWRATVAVEEALKGAPGRSVTVYFAASGDELWLHSPKLTAGETAIFLLQPALSAALPAGAYAVVSPLDVQPATQLDRVHRLLR